MTRKRAPHPAFAAWLRARLDARSWSAADLAKRVGVGRAAVYYWTAGHAAPLDPQVAAIAAALELDPGDVWAVLSQDGVTPFGGPTTSRPVRERPAPAMPADRPFPRWLRSALEARGWTSGQLARRIGIDNKTVHKWANGSCPPVSVHVRWLADALDADPAPIRELIDRADAEGSA